MSLIQPRALLALLPVLGSIACLSACEAEAPPAEGDIELGIYARHNLVLVTVDTLRADHLGLYGYERATSPRLDRLAADAVVFEQAQAHRGLTVPSLASILTGLYPVTANVRGNGAALSGDIPSLFGILKERGYETGAFLSSFCSSFRVPLDEKVCSEEDDDRTRDAAVGWIKRDREKPFFAWIHLRAPHEDYAPPARYDVFSDPEYAGSAKATRSYLDPLVVSGTPLPPADRQHVIDLYDGEVLYTDSLISSLWEAMSEAELTDQSVFVVTSDHGEELGDHKNYYYHACSIYEPTLHVPLIVRLPDRRHAGRRIPEIVQLVDLAPTLLGLLGADAPATMEGRELSSLMNRAKGESHRFDYSIAEYYWPKLGEILSLRTPAWRYIYNPDHIATLCKPRGDYFRLEVDELYDHSVDAGERVNVARQYPELVAKLRERVLELRSRAGSDAPLIRADPELLEQLEALGYLPEESEPEQPQEPDSGS